MIGFDATLGPREVSAEDCAAPSSPNPSTVAESSRVPKAATASIAHPMTATISATFHTIFRLFKKLISAVPMIFLPTHNPSNGHWNWRTLRFDAKCPNSHTEK